MPSGLTVLRRSALRSSPYPRAKAKKSGNDPGAIKTASALQILHMILRYEAHHTPLEESLFNQIAVQINVDDASPL